MFTTCWSQRNLISTLPLKKKIQFLFLSPPIFSATKQNSEKKKERIENFKSTSLSQLKSPRLFSDVFSLLSFMSAPGSEKTTPYEDSTATPEFPSLPTRHSDSDRFSDPRAFKNIDCACDGCEYMYFDL